MIKSIVIVSADKKESSFFQLIVKIIVERVWYEIKEQEREKNKK